MKPLKKNIILILIAIIIIAVPLALLKNSEFSGTDSIAVDAIVSLAPDYKIWNTPLFEPQSSEIESLLFALQAAIGAGILGFILGRLTARKNQQD